MKHHHILKHAHIATVAKSLFWFFIGVTLGTFLLVSFAFIFFQHTYVNRIYPGVIIDGVNFGGKTEKQLQQYFLLKNERVKNTQFTFAGYDQIATISAAQLDLGHDENLLAAQAYSIGRSRNILSNLNLIFQAYMYGRQLPLAYHYSEEKLENLMSPIAKTLYIVPTDALFTFQNGRVSAFRPSEDGQELDIDQLKASISSRILTVTSADKPLTFFIAIPVKTLRPSVTTDEANNLGIKELIGTGTSLFQGSIPSRIYNVTLAASRINGILVAPGETFSFNKALGDVSAFTGYKQAYVIQNGRTVLGDGGGVCQVSTTFFRALLNAGLPIVERHAHAYRVHYYEEDSPPGIDATIYVPTIDLKFTNDTGNYILIQNTIDPYNLRLTFLLYGTKDGRQITMTDPVIVSQTPPPSPLYQDDPTLQKGTEKQIDFQAWGADVYFARQVSKKGRIIIADKFVSNFRPWQAVYLRGTKE